MQQRSRLRSSNELVHRARVYTAYQANSCIDSGTNSIDIIVTADFIAYHHIG